MTGDPTEILRKHGYVVAPSGNILSKDRQRVRCYHCNAKISIKNWLGAVGFPVHLFFCTKPECKESLVKEANTNHQPSNDPFIQALMRFFNQMG